MKVKSESKVAQSCLTLSDPMDIAYQAPPSMGFSRQEYWSGVPSPSPAKGAGWREIGGGIGKNCVCHTGVSSVLLVSVMMTAEKIFLTAPISSFQQLPTSHCPNTRVPQASPHTIEGAVM